MVEEVAVDQMQPAEAEVSDSTSATARTVVLLVNRGWNLR